MEANVVVTRSIEIVTAEIHTIRDNVARVMMDGVIQIGRRLEEAKQLVPAGGWLDYLDRELGYKPSTAQNYMRIARELGDGQVSLSGKTAQDYFGALGYAQLLPLLGLPEEEREALAEEHDLAGMSSREIQALVKERDEARRAAEDAREQAGKAADEAQGMRASLEKAKDKLKAAQTQADERGKAAQANAETAAALQRRVDELEARADEPRALTEEELAALRAEIAAEQAEAVQAAEARAAAAMDKLEKAKNPAAHKVNFLFGELAATYDRLRAALDELGQTDTDTAARMRAAINERMEGWTV